MAPDSELVALRQRLGGRLRVLRETAELTQEQLGAAAGLDRKTISRIEGGAVSTYLDHLFHLARALDVEPIELFRW